MYLDIIEISFRTDAGYGCPELLRDNPLNCLDHGHRFI